jgi:hypothetical protein
VGLRLNLITGEIIMPEQVKVEIKFDFDSINFEQKIYESILKSLAEIQNVIMDKLYEIEIKKALQENNSRKASKDKELP